MTTRGVFFSLVILITAIAASTSSAILIPIGTYGAEKFLVQDICADAQTDVPVDGDPFSCPAGSKRRDIKLGEFLRYDKHDRPDGNNPMGFQYAESLPVFFHEGPTKVIIADYVQTYNMVEGNALNFQAAEDCKPGSKICNFDPRSYQVTRMGADWFSFVGTKDQSIPTVQPFWNANCELKDSWMVFPKNILQYPPGTALNIMAYILGGNPCVVGPANRADTTAVLESTNLVYTSGKSMKTIVSYHWALTGAGDYDHLEKFYFTDEYGLTRWERWNRIQPLSANPADNDPMCKGSEAHCGCNGNKQSGDYIMKDCRDWSYVDLRKAPLSMFARVELKEPFVAVNALKDTDFNAVSDQPGSEKWQRVHGPSTLNWSVVDESLSTNRRHIAISCTGPCIDKGKSSFLFQEVNLVPKGASGRHVQFGAQLWADSAGVAELTLTQLSPHGTVVSETAIPVKLTTNKQHLSFAIDMTAQTVSARFSLHPHNTNVVYRLRDAFVVPVFSRAENLQ